MNYNRKDFIRLSSGLALGAVLPQWSCSIAKSATSKNHLENFGLQLYTLRDTFEKDPLGVIKQLAGLGYKYLEGYERAKGIFWGTKNTEFKKYVDDLGMSFISSHCDTENNFEQKTEEAAAGGLKYLINSWDGPNRSIDWYKNFANHLNHCGQLCKKAGIHFAFHNHYFSFEKKEGIYPQDILMTHTDPQLVDFELDVYWVAIMKQDPEEWLAKYPNRFRLGHIKDLIKNPGTDNDKNSTDLGAGTLNIPSIIKTAKENGMDYFFVEQEYCPNGTPMEAVIKDSEYMKALKF